MTYLFCKRVIQNGKFGTKEDMTKKLDVFLLNDRINDAEYNELIQLVEETPAI